MKITAITIENFKGISEPVRVELKPITLLFGANSVGKSTIVQALHYVREILERNNVDADRCLGADESLDLGGFRNLVHNHELTKHIRLKIEYLLNAGDLPEHHKMYDRENDPDSVGQQQLRVTAWDLTQLIEINSAWIELEVRWSNTLGRPILSKYATGFNGLPFANVICDDSGNRVRISSINDHPSLKADIGYGCEVNHIWDPYWEVINENIVGTGDDLNLLLRSYSVLPQWGKPLEILRECYIEPHCNGPYESQINALEGYLRQLIVGLGELLLDELKNIRYIGPIRKIPPREYTPARFNDESRWASGLAAWDLLYKADASLVAETSDWLSREDRLDSGYSLKMLRYKKLDMADDLYKTLLAKGVKGKASVADLIEKLPEEKQLLLTDERRKNLEVRPQDVGIGISQILPVVVGALDAGTGILMIEQPELHIHPRLQTSLGDLFISQVQKEGKTFIIETHSEHLLLRLMRRMRESQRSKDDCGSSPAITPQTVGVWYVEQYGSKSIVREMPLNKNGELVKAWPGGFFEEGLREVL